MQESFEEQRKIRKILQRAFLKNSPKNVPERPLEEGTHLEPVYHNDKNLMKIGKRNMDAARYAVCLARNLWTDGELSVARLFPQRSNRSPLSPMRSDKFMKCLKNKYGLEDKDARPCILAVNQLCIDLANGKRKR